MGSQLRPPWWGNLRSLPQDRPAPLPLASVAEAATGAARPRGGAPWLLKLAEELHSWDDPDGDHWAEALQPLVDEIVKSYKNFLPKQNYPIRTGVHPNTAFGLAFALDYAKTVGDRDFEALLVERSRSYFAKDVDYPGAWEPGGEDFFSPALIEADLMRRVMTPADFTACSDRMETESYVGHP